MIHGDAMWLAAEPIDMRAVKIFGTAQAHHGYLFVNAGGKHIKLFVHCFIKQAETGLPIKDLYCKDGFGDATSEKLRARYGVVDVPDARHLHPEFGSWRWCYSATKFLHPYG